MWFSLDCFVQYYLLSVHKHTWLIALSSGRLYMQSASIVYTFFFCVSWEEQTCIVTLIKECDGWIQESCALLAFLHWAKGILDISKLNLLLIHLSSVSIYQNKTKQLHGPQPRTSKLGKGTNYNWLRIQDHIYTLSNHKPIGCSKF